MTGKHERARAVGRFLSNPRTRAYIYRVLVSLGPVAIAYGLLDEQQVVLWSAVAAQTLGVGLAARHTSTRKEQ